MHSCTIAADGELEIGTAGFAAGARRPRQPRSRITNYRLERDLRQGFVKILTS